MLPCGKKPTIQYVVEELVAAGVKDILFITGRAKRALEDHFDEDFTLFEKLENSGKIKLRKEMEFIDRAKVNFFFTRQAKPTGLADAVGLAKDFVDDESFYVALGDTIVHSEPVGNYLKRLADLHNKESPVGTILLEEVEKKKVQKYGIIQGTQDNQGKWKITDLIEKPTPEVAPSQLAICGRYIFTPEIFPAIEKTQEGIGGEKQLTDSIKKLIEDGRDFWGLELSKSEKRYDIGDPLSYTISFIELSLKDPEISKNLKPYLKDLVKKI